MRAAMKVVVCGLLLYGLLVAVPSPATARIEPCPNGGVLGNQCPAWVDENGDGKWQESEDVIYFTSGSGANDMNINTGWGDGNVYFGFSTVPDLKEAAAPSDYSSATWKGFCAVVLSPSPIDATSFGLWTNGCPGGAGLAPPVELGYMNLVDADHDGAYEALALWDTTGTKTLAAAEPYLETDIICTDLGGDGLCDHISVPWVDITRFGMDNGDGQPWIPIDQETRRLVFDFTPLAGNVPPSVILEARTAAEGIPTLTEFGALASLLGLAAAGWWLLRRRQVVA